MGQLKALDLFCGMGGLSWGLQSTAIIQSVWAVDVHPPALQLYENNFPETNILDLDLFKPSDIKNLLEKIKFYNGIDIVVGGSPCRGFTQIRNGQDTIDDPHNHLPIKFAAIVRELEPLFFIYESVPQLINFEIFPKLLSRLIGRRNYKVAYEIIEAANFGTPSRRTRLFVVGFRQDLCQVPAISKGLGIPFQEFWWQREIKDEKAIYSSRLREPWRSHLLDPNDISLVNAEQALSDLPFLEAGVSAGRLAYAAPPQSAYQKWVRQGSCKPDRHVVPYIRSETRERLESNHAGRELA